MSKEETEQSLTLDQMLSRMIDAADSGNFWDVEAYGEMALSYIDNNGSMNPNANSEDVNELREMITSLVKQASIMRSQVNQEKSLENFKNNLIEEIVNFK